MSFIRETHGDHFKIEVAAYPEMHPQAPSPTADFENFCRKVEAGADAALTQLFYNADAYFDFMERCGKAGITIPIVPGIMPITGFANTVRFCAGCGADLPRWVRLRLEELEDDKPALQDFGADVVTRLCETLLRNGAPGLHFYTINQAGPTLRLWKNLRLAFPLKSSYTLYGTRIDRTRILRWLETRRGPNGCVFPKATLRLSRSEATRMANDANSSTPPERDRTSLQVVRYTLVAVLVALLLLLGLSMVHHRFFRGGRVHQNGSIGR